MKKIRISIIGFGAVGQGVAKVIKEKREYLKKKNNFDLSVVAISDSKGSYIDEEGVDLKYALDRKKEIGTVASIKYSGYSGLEVIKKIDHEIVVEVTPTNIDNGEPGLTHMLTAFENSRHVVTSNKGPIALYYKELCNCANKNKVEFRYEATVGGAMPIINLAKEVLAGNEILSIDGILNGTCNYILTRMEKEGYSYEQALSEAKEIGIAEADPSYDVDGIDTACKLVILANSIFNKNATFKDVEVTGITKITPEALELASKNDHVIKLIGEVRKNVLCVAPRLIPKNHTLAVGGTLNVAFIQTDLAGQITVTGKGAGSIETASAILSDIICISKNLNSN